MNEMNKIIRDTEKEKRERTINGEMFDFYIRSLKQKMAFKMYVNSLLYFAAVLNIDEKKGG
jgi:hypothetical protein